MSLQPRLNFAKKILQKMSGISGFKKKPPMLKRMSNRNPKLQRPLDDFINIVLKVPLLSRISREFLFFSDFFAFYTIL